MAAVLVVEDEDQVRVLAESYLEEQGHDVLSAGTPDGALAFLQQSPQGRSLIILEISNSGAATTLVQPDTLAARG
jgi:CheY-like chemotaxis protein